MENVARKEELQRGEGEPGGRDLMCRSRRDKERSPGDRQGVRRIARGPGAGIARGAR